MANDQRHIRKEVSMDRVAASCRSVKCEGEGGSFGHPLVYLEIGPSQEVVCPYCSRTFVLMKNGTSA